MSEHENFFRKRYVENGKIRETFWLSEDTTLFSRHLITPFAYGESFMGGGHTFILEQVKSIRQSWSLELIMEGSGNAKIDSDRIAFSPGDIIIFNSILRNELTISPGNYCRKKVVIFNSNPATDHIMEANFVRNLHCLKLAEPWKMSACMKRMKELVSSEKKITHEELSLCGYEILLELNRQARLLNSPDPIDYVIALVTNKLSCKYSLDNLASIAGMNQRTFLRCFKKYMDCSPMRFIEQKRMDYAKFLLSSENISIGEVATLCGYADFALFSRVFKKHFGYSPKQYQKRNSAGCQPFHPVGIGPPTAEASPKAGNPHLL